MKGFRTVNWLDTEIDVHFSYSKGYPARLSGDPDSWDPGCDDEFAIESIIFNKVDVTALFSEDDLDLIATEIMENSDEGI